MNPYNILYLSIIALAMLCEKFKNGRIRINKKTYSISDLFYGVIAIILILFAGLVGDITSDHINYIKAFDKIRVLPFSQFFTLDFKIMYMEKVYGLLLWIIGQFTNKSVWVFIISSVLIVLPIVWCGRKSDDPILYLSLFLAAGYYFAGLNVVRQAIVASLFIIAVRYIQSGQIWKYCFSILILSLIQISALFMLPFYYLLRQNQSIKRTALHMAIIGIAYTFTYQLMGVFDTLLFHEKYFNTGRVDSVHTISKIIVPMLIFALCTFILSLRKNSHDMDAWRKAPECVNDKLVSMHTICSNASYYWAMFWIMTLKFAYFERITYYFFPLVAYSIANGVSRCQDQKVRLILKLSVFSLATVYYFAFGQHLDIYKFYFE